MHRDCLHILLPSINYEDMATAQSSEEPSLAQDSFLQLRWISLPGIQKKLLCDTSTDSPRYFVPHAFHKPAFLALYSLSHSGIAASQKLVTARFVWPSVNDNVRKWTRECIPCQRSKV